MAAEKSAVPLEAKIGDPVVRAALSELDRKLRARFGDRYVRLILFGSRARGDNGPDSDADVAAVLCGHIADRWSVERRIIGETYPTLPETGLYIESWPLEQSELDDPDRSSNPALLRNVLREGIRL
jgi:predicted nucleotidyltransferase